MTRRVQRREVENAPDWHGFCLERISCGVKLLKKCENDVAEEICERLNAKRDDECLFVGRRKAMVETAPVGSRC